MHPSEELIFELGRSLDARAEITSHLAHLLTAEPDSIWMRHEKLTHLPTAFDAVRDALQTFKTAKAPGVDVSVIFVPVMPEPRNLPANNALLVEAFERTDPDHKDGLALSDWLPIAQPWLLAVESRKEVLRLQMTVAESDWVRGTGFSELLVRCGIKKPDESFDPQPFLIHATVG